MVACVTGEMMKHGSPRSWTGLSLTRLSSGTEKDICILKKTKATKWLEKGRFPMKFKKP